MEYVYCPNCLNPMANMLSNIALRSTRRSDYDIILSDSRYDIRVDECPRCKINRMQIDNSIYWVLPERITPSQKQIDTADMLVHKEAQYSYDLITKHDFSDFIKNNIGLFNRTDDDYSLSVLDERDYK